MKNQPISLAPGPDAVVQRLVLDQELFPLPSIPPVIGGTWGDLELTGLWGPVTVEGAKLVWELHVAHGAPPETEPGRTRLEQLRNRSAILSLADGTRIIAGFGVMDGWGSRPGAAPGFSCAFYQWNLEG
ncbi:MAG TPA: hypothetical protein VK745_07175, partial [Polyangiaceae bacterium]|nr:hypothetical protein [Polyangiaceae bacterium]